MPIMAGSELKVVADRLAEASMALSREITSPRGRDSLLVANANAKMAVHMYQKMLDDRPEWGSRNKKSCQMA